MSDDQDLKTVTPIEDIQIDVDPRPYIESLDDDELHELAQHVDVLQQDTQHAEGVSLHEAKLPGKIDFLTSKHYRRINRAAVDLQKGRIDADRFRTRAQKSIADTFRQAYAAGKGTKSSKLTPGDEEYLRRAVETEMGYLDGFAGDLKNKRVGKPGKMSRQKRTQMYANSVEGIAWHGVVEKNAPTPETLIFWRLGVAEHCDDCLLLACLLNDHSPVLTRRGNIPFRKVVVGDEVWTHRKRWRRVLAKPVRRSTEAHRYAVLRTEHGLVGLTDDHGILTRTGWMTAKEVADGKAKGLHMSELRQTKEGRSQGTVQEMCCHQASVLLSELLSQESLAEWKSDEDFAVRVLRQGIQAGDVEDQQLEVGQCVLLSVVFGEGMACKKSGIPLHDLVVEEDHSFVVDGMVVHNSNSPYTRLTLPTTPRAGSTKCRTRCKCRLEFRAGKKTQDTTELAYKKDASLSELTKPPVPAGLRRPNDVEQRYVDNLRTKMNYQRRRIAREQQAVKSARTKAALAAAQDRLREAIALRKGYNRQLNEFTERNEIFETPVFSVDDVITEKDLGNRARRDIMRHGIDGVSLSMLDAKALGRLLRWYEEEVGDNLGDKAVAKAVGEAAALSVTDKINFISVPHALRGKSDRLAVNLVGEDLESTYRLLAQAVRAARGTDVAVGPFDGETLQRVWLWLEGDPDEVEAVLSRMRG